ncbi:MAG TPA: hypothetical protein VHV77_03080 [Pirellulales bacterium]|nr:hypothetical protein [Pirellulales bacterium]
MGNIWIVDLRHYLAPRRVFADMPKWARLLAEYFANIVVDATINLDEEPRVRCRHRPGRRRCPGTVMSYPACRGPGSRSLARLRAKDNGLISGWQNTLWDGFAANDKAH